MSTPGNSYEAWKESFMQAEPEGEDAWKSEERALTASCVLNSLVDMKGVYTGLILGVGLIVAGLVVLLPSSRHLAVGKRTVGMVVSYKDYVNRRTNTLVAPIIRYSAPGGVYDFVGVLSVPRKLYPIDKEVTVIYLPNDPKNAVVVDFMQMFMIPSIVCSLGFIVLGGTAALMFVVARSEIPANTAPAFNPAQKNLPPAILPPQVAGPAAS